MRFERAEHCDCTVIHEDAIKMVQEKLPEYQLIYEVSQLFRTFGDPTRARILCALKEAELCVCDLSALLSISQSAVSHQLRILKGMRMVKSRRNGKVVYYSLADEHIEALFRIAFTHVTEE
ncbi:MAG: metalloregulator ArsR/SmtB family transcription factor [Oscillospiraceae bacterium]|nr:metalloregulator ArsR/SmtB family transcription factor [Oscillospiraceae bacterium]